MDKKSKRIYNLNYYQDKRQVLNRQTKCDVCGYYISYQNMNRHQKSSVCSAHYNKKY